MNNFSQYVLVYLSKSNITYIRTLFLLEIIIISNSCKELCLNWLYYQSTSCGGAYLIITTTLWERHPGLFHIIDYVGAFNPSYAWPPRSLVRPLEFFSESYVKCIKYIFGKISKKINFIKIRIFSNYYIATGEFINVFNKNTYVGSLITTFQSWAFQMFNISTFQFWSIEAEF